MPISNPFPLPYPHCHERKKKGANIPVFFAFPGEALGTEGDPITTKNPLTGSLFFLEYSESPEPAPKYDYDETGVLLKGVCLSRVFAFCFQIWCGNVRLITIDIGTMNLRDENGNQATLGKGDTFFISRGSTMIHCLRDAGAFGCVQGGCTVEDTESIIDS